MIQNFKRKTLKICFNKKNNKKMIRQIKYSMKKRKLCQIFLKCKKN